MIPIAAEGHVGVGVPFDVELRRALEDRLVAIRCAVEHQDPFAHLMLADDLIVVRLAGRLSERRARRVDAPAQKLALTRALADKYGFDASMGSDM